MVKYFYEETGMYIDWEQLDKLPEIDTFIDVGVGPIGTPDLYEKFKGKRLILIDPLDEAEDFFKKEMQNKNAIFYKTALGETEGNVVFNVEEEVGNSSILKVSKINFEPSYYDTRTIPINTLDNLLIDSNLKNVGLKIDTEGFELSVIKGARDTLKKTKFVLAEVRHNHESFKDVYQLHEFMKEMQDNGFVLTIIMTAKPFIADLCFQPIQDL